MKNDPNLSRAVPPMPESFVKRMDETLKEIERMNKRRKLTVALAAALAAMLVLASVAVAQAIDSGVLNRLFGGQEVPQQAAELLQTDASTVTQDGITLSIDELLFDGRSLNWQWSVSSEREDAVFALLGYSLDGIGDSLIESDSSRGASCSGNLGDNALTMLGTAGEVSAPLTNTCYARFNFKEPLRQEFAVTVSAIVYTTELTPVLTDELYPDETLSAAFEQAGQIGVFASESYHVARLSEYPSFSAALAASPLLKTGVYDADGSIWNQANISAHEESGLMKKITEIRLTVPVQPVKPADSLSAIGPQTFELDDCTLVIEEVAFSPVSVTADMRIYPKEVKEGDSFFTYRVFASANGEAWYLNLDGEAMTDENGNLCYDVNLDGPPVTAIPDEIEFIRVDERREGEDYTAHYQRLIQEAPEGMRAVMKLR